MPRENQKRTEARRYRDQAVMTQAEFAKLVGCSTATIQSLELGRLKMSDSMRQKMIMAVASRTPEKLMEMLDQAVAEYRESLMKKYFPEPNSNP